MMYGGGGTTCCGAVQIIFYRSSYRVRYPYEAECE
jgi:hypothetical protein